MAKTTQKMETDSLHVGRQRWPIPQRETSKHPNPYLALFLLNAFRLRLVLALDRMHRISTCYATVERSPNKSGLH